MYVRIYNNCVWLKKNIIMKYIVYSLQMIQFSFFFFFLGVLLIRVIGTNALEGESRRR